MAEDEDWLELTDPLPKPARAAPQAAYAEPADAWSPVRPVTAQDPVQASLHRFVDEFQRRQDQANLLVAGGIGAAVVLTLIALSAYLSLGG
jgi:ferric-dicitrate binding protein FerR (iron transport regulator)